MPVGRWAAAGGATAVKPARSHSMQGICHRVPQAQAAAPEGGGQAAREAAPGAAARGACRGGDGVASLASRLACVRRDVAHGCGADCYVPRVLVCCLQRRQAIRQQLGLKEEDEEHEATGSDAPSEAEQEQQQRQQQEQQRRLVFHAGNLTSTVTVQPIATGSSDSEGGGREEDEGEEGVEGVAGRSAQHQHGKGARQEQQEQHAHGKKLSKSALRAMERTKMKVEGRRPPRQRKRRGGGSGAGGKAGRGKGHR